MIQRFANACGRRSIVALFPLLILSTGVSVAAESEFALAERVTIHRDEWGVPHIDGPTDESVVFGFGYAQAEDFLWQVEDSFVLATGRYAELYGPSVLSTDGRRRTGSRFPSGRGEDFDTLDPKLQSLNRAFTDGLNYYVQVHPDVKLRLLERFEPWYPIALDRYVLYRMATHSQARAGGTAARPSVRSARTEPWGATPGRSVLRKPARTRPCSSAIRTSPITDSGSTTKPICTAARAGASPGRRFSAVRCWPSGTTSTWAGPTRSTT